MSIFDVDIELSGEKLIKKLRKDVRIDIDQIFDGYNLKREYKFGKYIDGKFVIDKNIRNEEFFDRLAIESEEDLVAYIKDINRVNYLLGEDRHLTIEVVGLRLYVEFENEKAQKTYEKLGMEKTNYFIFEEEF
jgi:hypothetical protein